jgi:Antitoxin SocA-like, Panacea domain
MQFDKTKFKRLVHFIVWKAGKRDWFGATKLNKVLWFVDARAYTLTGKPITGETYTRGEFGPVPKHIMPVREELSKERTIKITKEGKQTRLVALEPANPAWFSGEELRSINWWIEHIDKDHTAASISEETHDYAWKISKVEELPLYAYRVARVPEEMSAEDLDWLKEHAKELGLL